MLDDVVRPGLRLIVCGTAAGTRSAELKHYYAGPGNKFWRTLAELGLTSRQLAPAEATMLLDFGIGLTDLVKDQSGADVTIRFDSTGAAQLRKKMLALQPQVLCFNGKRAAQEFFDTRTVAYGPQPECIGVTQLFVAPSTSAAANGSWDPSYWRDLAERLQVPPHNNGVQTDVASPRG